MAHEEIRAIVFDLGNTLIREVVDDSAPLDQFSLELLPGVKGVLAQLHSRQLKLGILSNTEQTTSHQLRRALRELGIGQYFSTMVTSVDLVRSGVATIGKPEHVCYEHVVELLGERPEHCAMVGNTLEDDVLGATACGLNAVLYKPSARIEHSHEHSVRIGCGSIADWESFDSCLERIANANRLYLEAAEAISGHNFDQGAALFARAAELSLQVGDRHRASALFARAAIAQEQKESWRVTSLMWYQAGQSLDLEHDVGVNLRHTEYDLSQHHYPSITDQQWDSIPTAQRRAKALRYAGYHAQNTNSPQDSYLLYNLAAKTYYDIGMFVEAAEVHVDACLSFIKEYGDLSDDYFSTFQQYVGKLSFQSPVDPGSLYLRQVAGALFCER